MPQNKQSEDSQYVGTELESFSHAKNWKRYWSNKILPLLGQNVLEVGAGIGTNLLVLYSSDKTWTSVEPDHAQFEQVKSLVEGKYPFPHRINTIHGILEDVPGDELYDSVLYIDVLEHIKNDQEEVDKAINLCRIGGNLIVLAPAHNFFYSAFDKAVGHFRRYNKKMLSSLTPVNADIALLYYLDSVGCLASLCNAAFLRSSMPTRKQILFWDRMMIPCSKIIDRVMRYSFGKTLVIVWERNS